MLNPATSDPPGAPAATPVSPLAGRLAPYALWIDVPRLVTAYYSDMPDPAVPAKLVTFGSSGHRASALTRSFNEWHVLAITQAICRYRRSHGIHGPVFVGIDTHALSEPAQSSVLEVLAANGVEVMLAPPGEYTPTPAVSRAILTYNLRRNA
ncbi:alpha-D-glucose phosphate-specific phosphoglucomutase, partial [Pseudomonas sp. MWU13-2625]